MIRAHTIPWSTNCSFLSNMAVQQALEFLPWFVFDDLMISWFCPLFCSVRQGMAERRMVLRGVDAAEKWTGQRLSFMKV